MRIRKDVPKNLKSISRSSIKKSIIPPMLKLDIKNVTNNINKLTSSTSPSVEGGTATISLTSSPSEICDDEDLHHSTSSLPKASVILIIICFVVMFILLVAATFYGIHHKRKLREALALDTNAAKKKAKGEHIPSIMTESTVINDDDLEVREVGSQSSQSQRSSGSSFLAIEVMTNTLSNIIKRQGGKIEVPSPTDPNVSVENELVKIKSLELPSEERRYSYNNKSENSFKNIIINIIGKNSSK